MYAARAYAAVLWWIARRSQGSDLLRADIARWVQCTGRDDLACLPDRDVFAYFTASLPEFRTVVHVRLRDKNAVVRRVLARMYPVHPGTFFEAGSVGPGLFIHHGVGTLVSCESIGANFWINQHVSLGFSSKGRPVVGDDVTIAAGAVVAGPITIASGTTVGANAVVRRSTEEGSVLVAPEAHVLTRRAADATPAAD
ncbi:serine O-acetyltransferase [Williamsia deligens]|nr:serine O-acetyltransferase [Williamsia deligens]